MVDDPATTHTKPRRKGGRPCRSAASEKALLGVDLAKVDPMVILREIAADTSQPGSTRVLACKTLLGQRDQDDPAENPGGETRINERAIAMMRNRAN